MKRLLTFNYQTHQDREYETAFGLKNCAHLQESYEKVFNRLEMYNKKSLVLIFDHSQYFTDHLIQLHQMGFKISLVIHPDEIRTEKVRIFSKLYCDFIFIGITRYHQLNAFDESHLGQIRNFKILFIAHQNLLKIDALALSGLKKVVNFPYSIYAPMHHSQGLKNHQLGLLLTTLEKTLRHEPEDFLLESLIDLKRSDDLHPFPDISPQFVFNADSKTEFSLVIPTFNNWPYLQKTLINIFANNLEGPSYEVTLVDDGSDDETPFEIVDFVKRHCPQRASFKYIYFNRTIKRRMGDGQFRAGIARNLGALHSTGTYLGFLDSDVLTPVNYISQVISELKSFDVVQTRRHDLTHDSSTKKTKYNDFLVEDLLFDDEYWNTFHELDEPWQTIPDRWKYICTHSLNLRRSLFYEINGIRPSYNFYGFEDTDLGYRLAKKNKVFHLSSIETFHLFHRPERSEFSRKKHSRAKLLKKTCEIFFRHNPTSENYRIFSSMLP